MFVFGSNGAGMHGGGAAYIALEQFGAIMGQAEGLQGNSYAINTMDGLQVFEEQAKRFIAFAKEHRDLTFLLTPVGCGIAGYTPHEVAGFFKGAVDVENIWMPNSFWEELI